MTAALYKLADEFAHVAERLEELEMDEQTISDTLESYAADFETKAISVGQFILNLEATIESIKQAEASMKQRRSAYEKKVAWVREYLVENMKKVHKEKVECGFFKMSVRTNQPSVEILDGAVLPPEYLVSKTTVTPDKKALKEAIESGKAVEGVSLVRSTSLIIK